MKKQVDSKHYEFERYMTRRRWASMWYQVKEVLEFNPSSVLEIGPGNGAFKALAERFGTRIDTFDIDPDLRPDYVGSADNMQFDNNAYDVVCAFQMLEHVPYELSLKILREMARVTKYGMVISLPNARPLWPYSVYLPKLGDVKLTLPKPWMGPKKQKEGAEHFWEINKEGYPLQRIKTDFTLTTGMTINNEYRVPENPYHHFLVFSRKN